MTLFDGEYDEVEQAEVKPDAFGEAWQQRLTALIFSRLAPMLTDEGMPMTAVMPYLRQWGMKTVQHHFVRHMLWQLGFPMKQKLVGDPARPLKGAWFIYPKGTVFDDTN